MFSKIYQEIVNHKKIVIIRHQAPDFDAYGSQVAMYLSIKNSFKDKEVLMDGDEPVSGSFPRKMDVVDKQFYKDALVIAVDTSAKEMLTNDYYKYAHMVVVMDHHKNEPNLGDIILIRSDYSSAAELITDFLSTMNFVIDKESATALYTGIVADSNRFLYSGTTDHTFKMASTLLELGADIKTSYKTLEREYKIEEKKMMGYVLSNFTIDKKVAYIYVDKSLRQSLNLPTYFVTRGCINLLSSIEGVEAFVVMAMSDEDLIYIEFRSKNKPVIEVAKKYNGGGHDLACGAKVDASYDIQEIIDSVNEAVLWRRSIKKSIRK